MTIQITKTFLTNLEIAQTMYLLPKRELLILASGYSASFAPPSSTDLNILKTKIPLCPKIYDRGGLERQKKFAKPFPRRSPVRFGGERWKTKPKDHEKNGDYVWHSARSLEGEMLGISYEKIGKRFLNSNENIRDYLNEVVALSKETFR